MTIEQTKKKHHYIPKFYLEGFADSESNRLWVYEKAIQNVTELSPEEQKVFFSVIVAQPLSLAFGG
jgi:hypothetical protein